MPGPAGPAGRPTPPRPGGAGSPMSRPGGAMGARPGGSPGGSMGARPGGAMGGAPGGGGLAARKDATDKKDRVIYFSQMNFDETTNDYTMTKATIATFVLILLAIAATWFFGWGINAYIGCGLALAFWLVYFIASLAVKHKMVRMPYKEKKNYWTYELTPEYKNRNVVLNDFKKNIAQQLLPGDKTVHVEDVSVDIISYDPLAFDFSIRSNKKDEEIIRTVPSWGSKFNCEAGSITKKGINRWNVVYPRKNKWETLAGRKVSPKDAIGDTHDPSVLYNPIGIRTDTYKEMCISNADAHTVITGGSGYGKSNTFNLIIRNLFPQEALILFFDMKRVEAAAVNDRVFAVVNHAQAIAWYGALRKEMDERNDYLVSKGAKKFLPPAEAANDPDAIPFSQEHPPIICAVDECGMWLSGTGRDQKKFQDEFLHAVARTGRNVGVTLVVGSQTPRTTDIPDLVRRNSTQFIAYRQPAETEAQALGLSKIDASMARPSDIPQRDGVPSGVGQFAFVGSQTNDESVPVKAYYVTAEEMTSTAKEYKNKKKTNLKIVRHAMKRYEKVRKQAEDPDALPLTLLDTLPASDKRKQ